MIVLYLGMIGGSFMAGWSCHSIFLRKLSKMSARIRRVQHGGRWHGK